MGRARAKSAKSKAAPAAGSRASAGDAAVVDWLLEGDTSIRWQVLRDLVGASRARVSEERAKVASEGWGARLLALQDSEGTWAGGQSGDGGLYSPKWTSTTYTMLLLRDLGLPRSDPHAAAACALLLDRGLQMDGGIAYGGWKQSETCVTGMVLSILSYFEVDDERIDRIADHLLGEQMPDGGWNCRRRRGATHSSVHTTISALEGLHHYESHRARKARAVRSAVTRGREFLLMHRLFRSDRTGKVIKSEFTHFHFPPRWHYDVLRALDHFREVGAPPDERLSDGIGVVRDRRQPDGRWLLERSWRGKTYFALERIGAASRWNTLRALRVLNWWEGN